MFSWVHFFVKIRFQYNPDAAFSNKLIYKEYKLRLQKLI